MDSQLLGLLLQKIEEIISVGKAVGKREPSNTVGVSEGWNIIVENGMEGP